VSRRRFSSVDRSSVGAIAADPPIVRAHATLAAFNSGTYQATIQLNRSPDTTVSGVPTSRAIPAAEMVVGRVVCVIFFDHLNSSDAMIVGVF
jgi:hypothetical protein